ncbi:hypothetical protein MCOR02_011657 [Pyricularia oryzae]|nr:hypothetical protein MCOR02_011657 [Pyricularia oryzae]KAI6319187.1 hypothetical protein MCOR34_003371 [Pyricularia oryzae]KAI6464679.1 hypothetical protein MCOR17_005258 [Pyricularia oryzae]KAI6644442.1 hypothetical protein MCOR14_001117 [Pyricularia oryzae]
MEPVAQSVGSGAKPSELLAHRYSSQVLAREGQYARKMMQRCGSPYYNINMQRVDF